MKVQTDRLETLPGGLKVGMALTDAELVERGRGYKKLVAGRYKLVKEGDLRHIADDELLTSVKLDGQLFFLYVDEAESFLYNPRGKVVMGLPLLEDTKALAEHGPLLMAGELYHKEAERSRVYDVTSALGSDASVKPESLGFAVFDLLSKGGERYQVESFKKADEDLAELLPDEGALHRVKREALDAKGLSETFNEQVVDGGQEGLVCLSDKTHMVYKVKQRHEVDAVVVGFTERPDDPGAVRVLLTALMRPDGTFQLFSKVGGGIEDDLRRELFRRLSPTAVESEYKETDREHTIFTMVKPELVVQVGFHDLIQENSSGRPQMKAVLSFDAEQGYLVQAPERFVTIIFPTFRGLREDKEVNPTDLRLTQLRDFVDLENLESEARSLDLAKSEIRKREVYTKTTKGLVSVRKFISWKTNKEDVDETYPPYVFAYVDYSPGRKKPLARTVRSAPSEEVVDELFDSFLKENVKRGWKPAGA